MIRKRLSLSRRFIEILKKGEIREKGYIRYFGELLLEAERGLKGKLSY